MNQYCTKKIIIKIKKIIFKVLTQPLYNLMIWKTNCNYIYKKNKNQIFTKSKEKTLIMKYKVNLNFNINLD